MLTFAKLSKKPTHVQAFTGLSSAELQDFTTIHQSAWEERRRVRFTTKLNRCRAIGGGRHLKLAAFEDRLLCFLVYTKLYCTYDVLGYLFDCDAATTCRIVADVRAVVGERLLIKVDQPESGAGGSTKPQVRRIRSIEELLTTYPDLEEVLLDVTEQKIPRPQHKKKRKSHHSGKKQAFTLMTQVLARKDSLLLHVSTPMAGRRHDVTLFKKSSVPNWLARHRDRVTARADGGYEGMDTQYPDIRILTPVKRQRNKPELTKQERRSNKRHSGQRIPVEHGFASLKQFRLLGQIYRGKTKHYKQYFTAIASVRNFRLLTGSMAVQTSG